MDRWARALTGHRVLLADAGFHHVMTYAYCWVGSYYTFGVPSGMWFCFLNYVVHAVMYWYFFLATYKGAALWWAPYVTHMQILQMAIGIWATFVSFDCPTGKLHMVLWSSGMYSVYMFLFIKLYYDKYFGPNAGKKRRPKASAEHTD